MTVHSCRDLQLGSGAGYATGSFDSMWAVSVFLQGVLGYTYQSSAGSVGLPQYKDLTIQYYSASVSQNQLTVISSSIVSVKSGSLFITSSGGHTLLQFSKDTVNLLSAAYPIGWPSGSGAWPGFDAFGHLGGGLGGPFDLGQPNNFSSSACNWVAIRSTLNPLVNSGIFRISNSTTWLSGNAIEIDYRSTSATVQETGSLVHASFWTPPPGSDVFSPGRTGNYPVFISQTGNGGSATSYKSRGSATMTRQILTSPSPLAWQLRLCLESDGDRTFQGVTNATPRLTCIPGFSGSSGDFPINTNDDNNPVYHLHLPLYFNSTAGQYGNTMPGLDELNVPNVGVGGGYGVKFRFYAWGDDVTGTCGIFIRNQLNSNDVYCMFGQAEAETVPLPPLPIQRLFFVGGIARNQGVDWRQGPYLSDGLGGMAFSLDRHIGPISCVLSTYAYAATQGSNGPPGGNYHNGGSIRFDGNGPSTPFLSGGIELLPCEVIAGTWDNWYGATQYQDILHMEPRILGRVPFARFGSSISQPSWGTADDQMQWFHITNGFFMPWGGITGL